MGDSLEQYRGRIGKYALRIPSLESFSDASSRSKKASPQEQASVRVRREVQERHCDPDVQEQEHAC